jgi:ABC-type branched-subunit amino acid transport system ATPase component
VLDIRDITVRFGGVRPLEDVSFCFEPGVNGLVGPNGAGKTTMLNVLSGFVRPAAGSVVAGGTNLLALAPHRRARWGLRRTFQQEQVIHALSGYDNLRLAADHLGGGPAEVQRVLEILELDRPERKATALSMLERRLVEIGKTIVGRPRVVLLDEPGAGLAESDSARLVPLIRRIAAEHRSCVVLVDHDMDLVAAVCQRIGVLDFGRRIAFGPTAEVLADPVVKRAYLGTEEVTVDGPAAGGPAAADPAIGGTG